MQRQRDNKTRNSPPQPTLGKYNQRKSGSSTQTQKYGWFFDLFVAHLIHSIIIVIDYTIILYIYI